MIIPDGTLESLKWLALLLMTLDHANKFLFNGTSETAFGAGRVAMPLFVFILAYNLARPGVLENGGYARAMRRLVVFGVSAMPALYILGGLKAAMRPLNIMFTLLVLTAMLNLVECGSASNRAAAVFLFLAGGANVEFWWPPLVFGLAVWWYCKRSGFMSLLIALTALLALRFVNGNLCALAVVPVVLSASLVDLHLPRVRWAFYLYYPVHLFALCLVRIPMAKAGYLFF